MKLHHAFPLLACLAAAIGLTMCQSTPGAGSGGTTAEMERIYEECAQSENLFDVAKHERVTPHQEISPEFELKLMYMGHGERAKEFWQLFIQDQQQRGRKKAGQDLRRMVRSHGVSTIMSFAYGRGVVGPETFDKIVQESQSNQTAFYRYINRPEVPLDSSSPSIRSFFKQAHPMIRYGTWSG